MGFAYNPASQIASNGRDNDSYSWTGHGSGTTSTTSDGLNRIGGWVTSLGYDLKGNITGDGTYTYGYSSENLLTSLANSATGAIQTSSTFAYDPLMRLAVIDSTTDGLDSNLAWDGEDFIFEGLSSNRTRRYVRGPGIDEPLVAYLTNSSGTSRTWYQADERGSIVRLSSDTALGGIGKYDEYGVGGTSRIRYAGQFWLADGSLHYSRARIYDARLGRFLQPDPIGYGSGMNIYAYVVGDPVNLIDPSGLKWVEACVGDGATMDCGWHWVGGGGGGLGGGGGRFEPYMVNEGGGGSSDGGIGEPLNDDKRCVGEPYASFFEQNGWGASGVAFARKSDPQLLLAVAALESGWGRSFQARKRNNPFGATPKGDATAGIGYPSVAAAWKRWNVEWGARIAGVADPQTFLTNLRQDNRESTTGVDQRGSYNSENPAWTKSVMDTLEGVRERWGQWLAYGC